MLESLISMAQVKALLGKKSLISDMCVRLHGEFGASHLFKKNWETQHHQKMIPLHYSWQIIQTLRPMVWCIGAPPWWR